ncbi:MAG: amidohydrolase [Firmicutes bacterium]|nr:amidohydrolase [Bacillota bacterium]
MAERADWILINATIHTVSSGVARAMALRDGRVMVVGERELVKGYAGPRTRVTDLGGATVVPGLIDSHLHFEKLGMANLQLDFALKSKDETLDILAEAARATATGKWLEGRGWNNALWPGGEYPTRHDLDRVSPSNPVFLKRACGHACWVNSLALAMAGVDRNTPDPPDGEIVRDETGEATGILVEKAMALVSRVIPPPGAAERKRAMVEADRLCLAAGLTGIHDAGVDLETIPLIEDLLKEDAVRVRLYEMLLWDVTGRNYLREARPVASRFHDRLTVRCIKAIADGSLGTRSAAMLDGYSDRPDWSGVVNYSEEQVSEMITSCLESGWQLALHCIGDRANRLFLDQYEEAAWARGLAGRPTGDSPRFRCEHAQVVAPGDIPRFASLGIIPSMQPVHASSDMNMAESRVGAERVHGAYAWRSFLATGARIPAGSDAPVESPNPFWGIYAAVTRQDFNGNPPGGWYPEQRMSRQEALRAFTIDAAYAAFEEDLKGSFEPGKLADAVIIDRDIMTCPALEIRDTRVLGTISGGRMVYRSADLAVPE